MNAECINSTEFRMLIEGGALNLRNNRPLIDSLNVFPVPDGDTGTNMNLTVTSSIEEIAALETDNMSDVCAALAKGALKGARGNSGVILSQIFKGMAEVIGAEEGLTTKIFAKALKRGADIAYDVVTHPKEGTILTVIRLVSEYALRIAPKHGEFVDFFKLILDKGEKVLDSTPDMLPVLKKAGVVDAGGKGLLTILYGMYYARAGIEMTAPEATPEESVPDTFAPASHNLEDIKFAYCTEYFIINLFKKTTISDIDKLRDRLQKIGDCVIVVGDLQLVKVHVHTNHPDRALGYALELGELGKLKIENMLEQNRELKKKRKKEAKPIGLVAICNGEGIKEIFKELHADVIIEGGQTMNPSVSNIVAAVDEVGADTVFILPNNSNIVMACDQAKEITESKLVVIATKNIPQGIAAAINFNPDGSIEENVEMMRRATKAVRSGQVTHSVKDTTMDGFDLKTGDIIGIYDSIVAKGSDILTVAEELVNKMLDEDTATISLYYGAGVSAEEAEELSERLSAAHPFYDIMIYNGGQQHYYYYVSVE